MTDKYDVVVSDFDGTICKNDIPWKVLQEFGASGWMDYGQYLRNGRMSFERVLGGQYRLIRAGSRQEILRFARGYYEPREGFDSLVRFSNENGTKIMIVSAGLDFCIRDFLGRFGLKVNQLICPTTTFGPKGIQARFPRYRKPARNFKEQVMLRLKREGLRTVYAGDGYSDLFPASQADVVFAVQGSYLDDECKKLGLEAKPFSDFAPVIDLLRC